MFWRKILSPTGYDMNKSSTANQSRDHYKLNLLLKLGKVCFLLGLVQNKCIVTPVASPLSADESIPIFLPRNQHRNELLHWLSITECRAYFRHISGSHNSSPSSSITMIWARSTYKTSALLGISTNISYTWFVVFVPKI